MRTFVPAAVAALLLGLSLPANALDAEEHWLDRTIIAPDMDADCVCDSPSPEYSLIVENGRVETRRFMFVFAAPQQRLQPLQLALALKIASLNARAFEHHWMIARAARFSNEQPYVASPDFSPPIVFAAR